MSHFEGTKTPLGKVIAPGPEPDFDNIIPEASVPKNGDARGGFGNRDDKGRIWH